MFQRQFNKQYNVVNDDITAYVQSATTSKSVVRSTVVYKPYTKSTSASISRAEAKVNVRASALSVTHSDTFATFAERWPIYGHSLATSHSVGSIMRRYTLYGLSSASSRSHVTIAAYSFAAAINYKPAQQTPIWIYDRNEVLRLVLLPRNQTMDTDALPYFDGWYKEQLNGSVSLEFSVPADHPDAGLIEPDGRAVIRDQDGNLVEFIIRQPEDSYGDIPVKTVYAEGADYELIDEWLTGYTVANVTLRTALEAVLQGTRWSVGQVGDFGTQSVDIKYMSVKEAVARLTELFGGERRYRIEANGNTITKRYIDILPQRGQRTGKRFEAGKDIISAKRTVDTTGIKTALYGYGASGENDGPRLTFASVEWSTANGDPVDKPLGQTWVGDPEALRKWGYAQGTKHRYGMYDGQETDPAELLLNTWKYLQTINDAVYTYEYDVALLEQLTGYAHEKVRLGDTVVSIVRKVNPPIETEEHIIEYDFNLNDPAASKVVLGNFRRYFDTDEAVRDVQKTVNEKQGNWDKKETPEGAKSKADQALAEAQQRIDEATQSLNQAIQDLDQAKVDLSEAQALIDDTIANPQNYTGQMMGDIIADSLIVRGPITAQNATITGTITGSNARLLSVSVEQADIINANIQNATITGTLNGVDGTFVGDIVTKNNAYVGNCLYIGSISDKTNKLIQFTGTALINSYDDRLRLSAQEIIFDGSFMTVNNPTYFYAATDFYSSVFMHTTLTAKYVYADDGAGSAQFRYSGNDYLKIWDGGAQIWINGNAKASWTSLPKVRLDPDGEVNEKSFAVNNPGSMQPLLMDMVIVDGSGKVILDERFANFTGSYSVFVDNGKVVNKQSEYFEVAGDGPITCLIIGVEKGKEDVCGYDLASQEEVQRAKTHNGFKIAKRRCCKVGKTESQ